MWPAGEDAWGNSVAYRREKNLWGNRICGLQGQKQRRDCVWPAGKDACREIRFIDYRGQSRGEAICGLKESQVYNLQEWGKRYNCRGSDTCQKLITNIEKFNFYQEKSCKFF